MKDLLQELAQARMNLDSSTEDVAMRQTALENTTAYECLAAAKEWQRRDREEIDRLTFQVREAALAAYAEDGNKKPCPGIQIKLYSVVEFDEAEALAWCRDYGGSLLRLDMKAFEKAAPALHGAPISITQEPRVTIARDLSEYLEVNDDSLRD